MSWGIVASVGASIVGGAIASDGAKDAAGQQAQSAKDATEAERQMFERQVELQRPWRDAGGAGLNRLAFELGLSPTGFYGTNGAAPAAGAGGTSAAPGTTLETAEQIRARLAPQYGGKTATWNAGQAAPEWWSPVDYDQSLKTTYKDGVYTYNDGTSPALDQAVQAELARQQSMQQQAGGPAAGIPGTAGSNDPAYGNLLRTFGKSDFEVDPGFAFRQEQGDKALQRAASASGGMGSGKFLKDAMRFNQGLASQEFGAAFDRFNVGQTNKFNRLAAISGIGQTAANQTGAAAANFGSQIGSNIIGAGNAMAAGRVGSANALAGGFGNAASMYQQNQMMNRFFPQGGTASSFGDLGGGGGNYNWGGGF